MPLQLVKPTPPIQPGYQCWGCKGWWLIHANLRRHEDTCEPRLQFIADATEKNLAAANAWLDRQREIGRVDSQGRWVSGWRPAING